MKEREGKSEKSKIRGEQRKNKGMGGKKMMEKELIKEKWGEREKGKNEIIKVKGKNKGEWGKIRE